MAITQSELIESLDPEKIDHENERRAEKALAGVQWPDAPFDAPPAFKAFMLKVMRGADTVLLRLPEQVSGGDGFDWGRCIGIMIELYGSGGWRHAYELATLGIEGGLRRVVTRFIGHMAGAYAAAEVSARVSNYWNALSAEEQLEASKEYLARYGHLLPRDLTEDGAALVRAHFPDILKRHCDLMKELSNVGRQ